MIFHKPTYSVIKENIVLTFQGVKEKKKRQTKNTHSIILSGKNELA